MLEVPIWATGEFINKLIRFHAAVSPISKWYNKLPANIHKLLGNRVLPKSLANNIKDPNIIKIQFEVDKKDIIRIDITSVDENGKHTCQYSGVLFS